MRTVTDKNSKKKNNLHLSANIDVSIVERQATPPVIMQKHNNFFLGNLSAKKHNKMATVSAIVETA